MMTELCRYKLQNNVHIVSGAKNHCIYDLNSRKLYHLDSEHLEFLYRLVSEDYEKVPVEVREFFIKEGIVIPGDSASAEKNIDFAWIEIHSDVIYIADTVTKVLPKMWRSAT